MTSVPLQAAAQMPGVLAGSIGANNPFYETSGMQQTDLPNPADDLTDEDIKLLRNELSNYKIEGDLRREVAMNIKRLQEIGSYRGLRHKRKLPCRGQRTKTNARTQRGKKGNAIAGKK